MKDQSGTRIWVAAILAAIIASAGCSSGDGDGSTGPTPPQPGTLTVNISTTGGGGAAFLLTVVGDSIENARTARNAHTLFSNTSGRTLKAAVIGSAGDGDGILRFDVPDVNRAGQYNVTLNEVAGSDNALQSTSDYTLTLTP